MEILGSRSDHELERLLGELGSAIARFAVDDGDYPTPFETLTLYRRSAPSGPMHCVYRPGVAVVAQGRKAFTLADEAYVYGRGNYLLVSVDLPVFTQVIEATPEAPLLCAMLELDPVEIGQVMIDARMPRPRSEDTGRGLVVSSVDARLLDAFVRLVRLVERPEDVRVLGPLVVREIVYLLLVGEQGRHLRQMALDNSRTRRVSKAIAALQEHYAEPLPLDELASTVNMSPSGFHHYFKAVTGMTPLQYQKQLRLQEARRLMLSDDVDAATAGFTVGYESPSQFSREYRRLFGEPPVRDITRLRAAAV